MVQSDWDYFEKVASLADALGPGSADDFPTRIQQTFPPGMSFLSGIDYALSADEHLVTLRASFASREHLLRVTGENVPPEVHQEMAEEVSVALAYAALRILDPTVFTEAEVSVAHEDAAEGEAPLAFVSGDFAIFSEFDDTSDESRFEQTFGVASPRAFITPHELPVTEPKTLSLAEWAAARRQARGEPERDGREDVAGEAYQRVRRYVPQKSEERQARIAELRAGTASTVPPAGVVAPLDPADMHPREFELLVKRLLEAMGLTARETPYSKDDGVDVVAEDHRPFRRGRVSVQVKRYAGSVGVTTVRELNGVLPLHRAQRGIVVTTGSFTREAIATARQLGIELIDGMELRQALAEHLGE